MTAPLIIAIALSISSPSQYRYVEIGDGIELTGSGLVVNDSGNTLVRGEDAAFLHEAYAEQLSGTGGAAQDRAAGEQIESQTPSLHWASVFNVFSTTQALHFVHNQTPISTTTRAVRYESARNERNLYCDVFGSDDALSRPFTNESPCRSGTPLSHDSMVGLYGDLNKTRTVVGESYLQADQPWKQVNVYEQDETHAPRRMAWDHGYDEPSGWLYGEYGSRPYTNDYAAGSALVRLKRTLIYGKVSVIGQYFPSPTFEEKYYGPQQGYFTRSDTDQPPDIRRTFAIPFGTEITNKIHDVKAFAVVCIERDVELSDEDGHRTVSNESWRVVKPIPCDYNGREAIVTLAGPAMAGLIDEMYEVIGVSRRTMADVAGMIKQPTATERTWISPETSCGTEMNTATENETIYIYSVVLVGDVTWDARTLSQ